MSDEPAPPAAPSPGAAPSPVPPVPAEDVSRTYWSRLGFTEPNVEELGADPRVTLRQLMLAIILRRSGPTEFWEILAQIEALGTRGKGSALCKALYYACVRGDAQFRLRDGRFDLDLGSPEWARLGRTVFKAGARREPFALRSPSQAYAAKAERRRAEVEAQCARRALVHVLGPPFRVFAAVVIDPVARSARTLVGDAQLATLPALLRNYDVLIGLSIRETLECMDLRNSHPWRVIDLSKTPKSRRIDGRRRRTESADFIACSLGFPDPVDNPTRIERDFRAGDQAGALRRLRRDAATLYAFYRYGVVHRGVRLKVTGCDALSKVAWSELGDATVHELVAEAKRDGRPIQVVLPPFDASKDPWASPYTLTPCEHGLHIDPIPTDFDPPGGIRLWDVLDARRM